MHALTAYDLRHSARRLTAAAHTWTSRAACAAARGESERALECLATAEQARSLACRGAALAPFAEISPVVTRTALPTAQRERINPYAAPALAPAPRLRLTA
jgi:hypothetical protein